MLKRLQEKDTSEQPKLAYRKQERKPHRINFIADPTTAQCEFFYFKGTVQRIFMDKELTAAAFVFT